MRETRLVRASFKSDGKEHDQEARWWEERRRGGSWSVAGAAEMTGRSGEGGWGRGGRERRRAAVRRWLPRDELHRWVDARSARTHTATNDKSSHPTKGILGTPLPRTSGPSILRADDRV